MDRDLTDSLTKNLIRLRIQNRYSQRQIAELLEITQPSYHRIECGKTELRTKFLFKLASFYRVMIEDLADNPRDLINNPR